MLYKDAEKYEDKLKKVSNVFLLSYYQQVEKEINDILKDLYNQTERSLNMFLDKRYSENYYKTSYDIQNIQGYQYITKVNNDKLKHLKSMLWLSDGKEFSDRLWKQKDVLVNTLREEITVSTLLQKGRQDKYKR